jgi:hypothetical protein
MNHGIRAAVLLTSLGLFACTSMSPSVGAPVGAPTRAEASDRVVPIEGVFVGDDSLGGRVDVFTSRAPVEHCRAELYANSFPTEEFDAEVFRVTSVGDSRYVADLRLERPDPRIEHETRFRGFIFNADGVGAPGCADSKP